MSPVNVNYEGEKLEVQQVQENQDVQVRSVWTYTNYIADCTPGLNNNQMTVQFAGKYLSITTSGSQGSGAPVYSYTVELQQPNMFGVYQRIALSGAIAANGSGVTPFSGVQIDPNKPVSIVINLIGQAGCTANISIMGSSYN